MNYKYAFVLFFVLTLFGCENMQKKPVNGFAVSEKDSTLSVVKQAPQFSIENYDSEYITSASLKGSYWIASFMFTSCGGVCPVMNSNIAFVQESLEESDVKFVSFTVDPETDTRERLAAYAAEYKADPKRWFFVRSSLDTIRELATKGFYLSDPVQPSDHSPKLVLVDPELNVRGFYDSMDSVEVRKLIKDIKTLKSRSIK